MAKFFFGYFVIILLVKYYVPFAHITKVIKVLNIKSAVNCNGLKREAQSRQRAQWYFAMECFVSNSRLRLAPK